MADVVMESTPMDSPSLVFQLPQTEEATVVEAAGVNSDPIAGVTVWVTPQNNDSYR